MYASVIPAAWIDKAWAECKPMLEDALRYANDEFSIDDVYEWISRGEMQLWAIVTEGIIAAATTEIVTYPRKKILRVTLLGGKDMNIWLDTLIKSLEEYGSIVGADSMEAVGRKGWIRVLGGMGWKEQSVIMDKEI